MQLCCSHGKRGLAARRQVANGHTVKSISARKLGTLLLGAALGCGQVAAHGAGTPEAPAPDPAAAGSGWNADDTLLPVAPTPPTATESARRGDPSLRLPGALLAQSPGAGAAPPGQGGSTASATEFGANRSYGVPALEILGFDFLLNRFNRRFSGSSDYDVTLKTIRSNLHSSWTQDNDPYKVNQFAHPYQGSLYHGAARSAGLDYWTASAYTFAGSVAWEIAGEKTRPAKNDQIASGVAGSFLGEVLFRMSSLVLEQDSTLPQFWREVAAAAISPPTGFNRLAYGNRFDPVFSSRGAHYYSRLQIGLSGATRTVQGTSTAHRRGEVLTDYYMAYGLPGQRGYEYTRPFDYFSFQFTASSANVFENILTRGMLVGQSYEKGQDFRGIWGLYGSYDYISPQTYRISSTALSLGTTAQWWLSQSVALQGTAMLGAGYAAVGTLRGGASGEYHYGVAPQALVAARVLFGNKVALEVTAREYFVNNVGSRSVGGHDNIARADVALTYRVAKRHSVALKYLWNRRDATYSFLGNGTQERSTLGIFYSYDGDDRFGAVDWR